MIIEHVKPGGWVDTDEPGLIQPSEVAGLVHVVTFEPGELIEGPQGVPGEKGDTGEQGLQGVPGAAGVQGAQGLKGDAGEQGPQGVPGAAGVQGMQGLKGDTGEQGLQGVPGAAGAQGAQGLKGDTGAQGAQGIKGDKGDTGAAGVLVEVAGKIQMFRRKTAPAGWLEMKGVGVLVASYPELVAAVYVGDAANATEEGCYRCNNADGSGRNVTGAYLFLEDCRGEFLRGWDNGRGVDGGRVIGSAQGHQLQDHVHVFVVNYPGSEVSQINASPGGGQGGGQPTSLPTSGSHGSETRPRNRSYLICISTGR